MCQFTGATTDTHTHTMEKMVKRSTRVLSCEKNSDKQCWIPEITHGFPHGWLFSLQQVCTQSGCQRRKYQTCLPIFTPAAMQIKACDPVCLNMWNCHGNNSPPRCLQLHLGCLSVWWPVTYTQTHIDPDLTPWRKAEAWYTDSECVWVEGTVRIRTASLTYTYRKLTTF